MNSIPKVSFVIGMYNESEHLVEAIESILKQSFQDFEIIICDDCSTDDSLEKLKRLYGGNAKFTILHSEKNAGVADAVNRGLPLAKGEYIARMDLDDLCANNRLEKEVSFLDSHPEFALCSSLAYSFDSSGIFGLIGNAGPVYPKQNFYSARYVQPAAMIRKQALFSAGGYDAACRRSQDYDLWCKFGSLGLAGFVIDEPLLLYRCNTNEVLRKRNKKNVLFVWKLHKKWRKPLHISLPLFWLFSFRTLLQLLIPARLRNKINRTRMANNLRNYMKNGKDKNFIKYQNTNPK